MVTTCSIIQCLVDLLDASPVLLVLLPYWTVQFLTSSSVCVTLWWSSVHFFCCWAVYKHVLQSEHADYIETTKEEIIEYSSSLSTVAVIWLDLIAAESAINGADVAKHLSVLLHFKIILSGLWQLAETIAVFSVDVYYYFWLFVCVFTTEIFIEKELTAIDKKPQTDYISIKISTRVWLQCYLISHCRE